MRRWYALLGAASISAVAIAVGGCSTEDPGTAGTTSAAATITYTVPPITVVSTAPAETVTETATETTGPPPTTVTQTVTEEAPEPFTDENSSDLTWWTCDRLVRQAAETSGQTGQQPVLLKVRAPVVVEDYRKTVETPTGANTSIVLSCKGTAVWSKGPENEVTVTLSIDADEELMISYRSQSF